MLKDILFLDIHSKARRHKEIPGQYKEELFLQLLYNNLNRESILSWILLIIDVFLLVLDFISTKGWTIDEHIFGHFSYLHILLMIVPVIFLIFASNKKTGLESNISLLRKIHLGITLLVLFFCSLISMYNGIIDKLPYPYIIAMFCIASTILLNRKERFTVYLISYIPYVVGNILIGPDTYLLVRNLFFITLLVILALVISHMNYASYINDFINHKIILDKNLELDRLYRNTEETLKKRTKELNETVEYEKLRAAFFANISHELRTPLTVIFSAEQMLDLIFKKDNFAGSNKAVKRYMDVIRQNCYRLIRLVANLIDITKIDAGYFHVSLINCDIVKVIEDITLSVAKFIEDREIELVFDTDVEELVVACDPDKIERIVLNLLSNAVKFTPRGGSIFVNLYDEGDILSIHIKDTGIGIPESMRQSIFERFVQVDKTISRNREGSGIGLSLVKSLVDMHQGTIRLVSEEGKGSEFIIGIPKKTAAFEKIPDENNLVSENQNVEKINIEFSDIYK